jgi:YgiT-type zinc finger domain-containing protein
MVVEGRHREKERRAASPEVDPMSITCPVCREGTTRPGTTSYTFERDGRVVVVNAVPADVCSHCGEAWLADLVAGHVLSLAAEARRARESFLIREYVAV